MLDGEPLSGAPESCHHFVRDEDDAVAVADLADALQVAGWRHHDARGAWHRLEDQRRERQRVLHLDQPLEVFEGPLRFLLLGLGMERGAIQERPVEVHDTAVAVVVGPATWVACQVHRGVGATVVGPIARQHLVPAGVQSGHPYGVFDGVGATIGEEHSVEITWCPFGDQPCGLRTGGVDVCGCDGAQFGCLFGNGGNDFRVLMADVGVDHLRREVQQLVAVTIPDV